MCSSDAGVRDLITAHLEPKTRENYQYGKRKLLRWLKVHDGILTESAFLMFVADCFRAGLSYHVPNFARSWLADYEKVKFNKQVITSSFRVKMALDGYKRMDGRRPRVRRPLSVTLLRKLLRLDLPPAARLCFLLSYVFLLRVSETVSIARGEGAVTKTAAGYILFLKKSKADPEAKGVSVMFRSSEIPADLVAPLEALLPRIPLISCPAPADLNAIIHGSLGQGYTFHCLRHGRATDLFKEGKALSRLMVLGRWSTKSSVTCYLH